MKAGLPLSEFMASVLSHLCQLISYLFLTLLQSVPISELMTHFSSYHLASPVDLALGLTSPTWTFCSLLWPVIKFHAWLSCCWHPWMRALLGPTCSLGLLHSSPCKIHQVLGAELRHKSCMSLWYWFKMAQKINRKERTGFPNCYIWKSQRNFYLSKVHEEEKWWFIVHTI